MNESIKNCKILIIEDKAEDLKVIHNILSKHSFSVLLAQTGNDGLDIIKDVSPDLIVLDIRLPDIIGYDICKLLKEKIETQNIPIIFISVLNDVSDKVKAFKCGAVDYITKPFNEEEVLARVITHLTIKKQEENLVKLNNMKDTVFSSISHDLKSPLLSIYKVSELLNKKSNNLNEKEKNEFINSIYSSSKKIYFMIDNLLEWSLFHKNKIEETENKINLKNITNEVSELLEDNLSERNIKFINNITEKVTGTARGNMIKTVLRNLIYNAIKFSNDDGEIIIDSRINDNNVEVSVKDNGVGIKPEHINNIFKLNKDKIKTGISGEIGSGIGLIICKDFIEYNEGQIWVESEVGKGSTFYFTLKK